MVLAALVGVIATADSARTADWTVLAYLSGDGSLEAAALEYARRLASAPPTERVSVAVQIDRSPGFSSEMGDFEDARRVVFDATDRRKARAWRWSDWRVEVNMGDPRTLAEFLSWGIGQLPAERYLVLMMGHGSGVRPLTKDWDGRDSGVAYDSTSAGDSLTPTEVRLAASQLTGALGDGKIDVLAIDACFSASAEVASEVSECADFMTGSPDLLYDPGVPWDQVLAVMCEFPDIPAEDIAKLAVTAVRAQQSAIAEPKGSYAAVRLEQTDEFEAALGALCEELRESLDKVAPAITAARASAARSGLSGEMLDLRTFLASLAEGAADSGHSGLAELATKVTEALDAMIVASYSADEEASADGGRTWSVFFPPNLSAFPADYLETSDFARTSGWGAFLEEYLDHLLELVTPTAVDGVKSNAA